MAEPQTNPEHQAVANAPLIVPAGLSPNDLASQNFNKNLAALASAGLSNKIREESKFDATEPSAGGSATIEGYRWVFARDGSLTGRSGGRSIGGCSVPRRTAELLVRTLVLRGRMGCLLLPTHPQQIIATLDRIDPSAGLVVYLEDEKDFFPFLCCCDFSQAIDEGRLFFATHAESLADIFITNPGLPIPQQFVTLGVVDAADINKRNEPAIAVCQTVFAKVANEQAARIAAVVEDGSSCGTTTSEINNVVQGKVTLEGETTNAHNCGDIVLVAGGGFTLWADAGHAAAEACGLEMIDTDRLTSAAPIAVATAAVKAGAMMTINTGRADWPKVLHPDRPWITWVTTPVVPRYVATSGNDGIILANAEWRNNAAARGWPADRVRVGRWPRMVHNAAPPTDGGKLVVLFDLPDLSPPPIVEEYSSWRVLWELIRDALTADPWQLDRPELLLRRYKARVGISDEGFPAELFIDRVIAAGFAIGVVHTLHLAGVAFSLYGQGWSGRDDISGQHTGAVSGRPMFKDIMSSAAGIIDVTLVQPPSLPATGRPVLRALGRTRAGFLQDCQKQLANRTTALTTKPPAEHLPQQQLSRALIDELIHIKPTVSSPA